MGDQGSHRLAERMFDEASSDFLRVDLVDGGRSLQPPVGSLGPKMRVHLSPMEGRAEGMIRVLLVQVSSLRVRVLELESRVGVLGGLVGAKSEPPSFGPVSTGGPDPERPTPEETHVGADPISDPEGEVVNPDLPGEAPGEPRESPREAALMGEVDAKPGAAAQRAVAGPG